MNRVPLLARSLLVGALLATSVGARAVEPASVERGVYLYNAAGCGGCHGSPPSGGLGLDTPFGTFRVPNITPDMQHGIGGWSQAQFQTALRDGIGAKGEYLFPVFPFTSFTHLTDRDIGDLYAYLTSVPAVPEPNQPHQAKAIFGWRPLLFFWRTLFFSPGPLKNDKTRADDWNRGNYLVHAVAHCEECHTPRNILGAVKSSGSFSGNIGGPDGQNAPNITSDGATGIGGWSVGDVQTLLKSGMTPDSDQVGSGMKAVVRGTSKLTDEDRRAIAVYLKSVPPIRVDLPSPKAASLAR